MKLSDLDKSNKISLRESSGLFKILDESINKKSNSLLKRPPNTKNNNRYTDISLRDTGA